MNYITQEQAHEMGAKGAPATEDERLLFEAWMRGHCWALSAIWDGNTYRGTAEDGNCVCPKAMNTRQLWAVWRDRAALAQAESVGPELRHRIRVHLSNRYYYSHKEFCEKLDEIMTAALAQPAKPVELSDDEIKAGWEKTFSTNNPYCPCNLKSFTKAVNWTLAAAAKERT